LFNGERNMVNISICLLLYPIFWPKMVTLCGPYLSWQILYCRPGLNKKLKFSKFWDVFVPFIFPELNKFLRSVKFWPIVIYFKWALLYYYRKLIVLPDYLLDMINLPKTFSKPWKVSEIVQWCPQRQFYSFSQTFKNC
jgi:hypothetical protein